MFQKLFCLSAVCALLFVFATANTASAQSAGAPADCPCAITASPCQFANPCCPPVAYRVGPRFVRPVVYAPVYRVPVYRAPVYRPVYVAPKHVYAPRVVAFPAYYAW